MIRSNYQLEILDLSNNNGLTDLSKLAALTQLRELRLANTQVKDLTPLQRLKNLTTLDLSYTRIQNIEALAGLNQLKSLDLRGTKIVSLKGLPHSVTELILGDTPIEFKHPRIRSD